MSVTTASGVSATLVQPAIYRGAVAPTSATIGDLWEDTSTDPPVLKHCTVAPSTFEPVSSGGGGGGADYPINTNITSMEGLTGGIGSPTFIQMGNGSGTTLAAGKAWYDNTTGSWNLGMGGGNITQQVGEELFLYGKASSAVTDSPLQIVYQTGTVGASGVITFAPTVSGITDGNLIVGIATEAITTNAFGRVTKVGVVHGITTDGAAYGETWADGDTIWYNPVTGNPTKVKPVAPSIKVQVGTVINAGSGGSGSFQVEINHGSVLGGTDSNVQLTSSSGGQLLIYNASTAVWENGNSPRLLPRVVVISDATSITINADTTDVATQVNTQAAGTLTINAPTGTPVNGQKIMLRLTSTNVQTFSFNPVFLGSIDLALPTASSGSSKEDYLGFIYDSTAAKWHLIAKNFGF